MGARMISGAANISLSNYANNRIYTATAGDSLTFASGVTVQGAGQIGAGTATTLTNNGTWLANQSTGMVLSTTGAATNNNLIRADGANFSINQTSLGQGATGTLNAINGGSVILNNGTQITGGIFSTASGGQVVVGSGQTARFAGVNNTGALNISNNSTLILNGALTNNGVINFQSGGNVTDLRTDGNQSINGIGSINLSNYAANRIYGVAAGDSLTLGSGQTLQGAGSIGAGTQFNFTNNGTMLGNQSNALQFYSSGTVANNGLVRADGGNVLITGGTAFGQSGGGVLSAINGGVVTINANAAVTGGTLATTDTGQFTTQNGGTATIANLANTGTFNVVNNSVLRLQGTVTNAGTLNLKSGGNVTDLLISGAVTLVGNGTTTLSDYAANRIFADGAGAQLTVGAGQTLQGAGQLGVGTVLALLNQGTITANQSNALTVSMSGGVQNAASGLMQATAGGTLTLNSALSNSGTLSANGGVVNANQGFTGTGTALITGSGQLNVAAPSTVGTLTHNGTSANGLALGANSITVSSDYTNASSGSGNTFNRRANVTGAGQILAGGNAAQTITGSNVTNGNTANATLTIGNLRVGATTFNYQVGNVGSTGPTLRGAIQTNVNGGNITDGQLSGAGVTASNYSAGAPGANSGNLGVTFNAAPGALTLASSQAINLRSNFENIPDQKLNIVLASGAAAYNAAVGSAAPSSINLGNFHVGAAGGAAPQSQAVAITNTVAGPFTEGLGVQSAAVSGAFSLVNNIGNALVAAGGTAANALAVSRNGGAAGINIGTLSIQYTSDGNGTSGLAAINSNSQNLPVAATGYRLASANDIGAVSFGNVHVGDIVTQALSISNTAINDIYSERLNASFGGVSDARITTNGSAISLLGAGQTNAASMVIGLNTGAAGNVNGTVTVKLQSDGTGTSGLGTTALPDQNVGVSGSITTVGNVYRLASASPVAPNPVNFQNVRINTDTDQMLTISNTAVDDGFSEKLNASIGAATSGVTAGGAFNLLMPQATNNSSPARGHRHRERWGKERYRDHHAGFRWHGHQQLGADRADVADRYRQRQRVPPGHGQREPDAGRPGCVPRRRGRAAGQQEHRCDQHSRRRRLLRAAGHWQRKFGQRPVHGRQQPRCDARQRRPERAERDRDRRRRRSRGGREYRAGNGAVRLRRFRQWHRRCHRLQQPAVQRLRQGLHPGGGPVGHAAGNHGLRHGAGRHCRCSADRHDRQRGGQHRAQRHAQGHIGSYRGGLHRQWHQRQWPGGGRFCQHIAGRLRHQCGGCQDRQRSGGVRQPKR
ncbi:MAG: choice-of-anchor D domain-containing protein [Rubrivivax sp.]|nr:choice-of-anchor D domain-containing protein [Rubrivivax sp.]